MADTVRRGRTRQFLHCSCAGRILSGNVRAGDFSSGRLDADRYWLENKEGVLYAVSLRNGRGCRERIQLENTMGSQT